jgi:protein phosphatase
MHDSLISLKSFGLTNRGLVKEANEDYFSVNPSLGLFVVADGMGGHQKGDVASRIAVEMMVSSIEKWQLSAQNPEVFLNETILNINTKIFEMGAGSMQNRMGCTFVVAWFVGEKCLIGHVGDARAYAYIQNQLQQVTTDHTMANMMVEAGYMTPEEVKNSPYRHGVERALGPLRTVEPDINVLQVHSIDMLLLCSDGLWDMVENQLIEQAFARSNNVQNICETLIDQALNSGGKDNITSVIVKIST